MPKHYHRRHHHHRRYHKRRHVHRPLIGTKQYCRITCRTVLSLNSATTPGNQDIKLSVAWQQPQGLANDTYGFNFEGSQFLAEYRNWEEFAITGCKVSWVPAGVSSKTIFLQTAAGAVGTASASLDNIFLYDDPTTYTPVALTDANVLNRKDTKIMPVQKTWTHYCNARPFSASQNVAWQDVNTYSS